MCIYYAHHALELALAQGAVLRQITTLEDYIGVALFRRTRPFMFADTPFDAALYAGTVDQVGNWAGTRAVRLLAEDMVPVCSPRLMGTQATLSPAAIAQLPLLQQSTRDRPLQGKRGYFLVTPERGEERPVMATFMAWIQQAATQTA